VARADLGDTHRIRIEAEPYSFAHGAGDPYLGPSGLLAAGLAPHRSQPGRRDHLALDDLHPELRHLVAHVYIAARLCDKLSV
jgi:hypothetical protein